VPCRPTGVSPLRSGLGRIARSCATTASGTKSAWSGKPVSPLPCLAAFFHGPGWDRTSDLGIKSPAERAATSCARWQDAETRPLRGCSRQKRDAAHGDKRVRAFVREHIAERDNADVSDVATKSWAEGHGLSAWVKVPRRSAISHACGTCATPVRSARGVRARQGDGARVSRFVVRG